EMKIIAGWIDKIISNVKTQMSNVVNKKIREEVKEFLKDFPAPGWVSTWRDFNPLA
ncbi:hypothetical protein HY946_00065, partial [Candidatus Gottesmanbacteria bacterium]|nr:hypothetical protein [Candidatus Gottesmanbacteria bacterium]